MANKRKNVKDILKAVNLKVEEVVQEIREEIDNFRPVLEKDINKAIKKNSHLFDIEKAGGKELVRELGIGEGGEINEFKTKNTWEALLIGYPTGGKNVSSLLFSKDKRKLGKVEINFNIDSVFYDLNLTTYQNDGRNGPKVIPFIKWFIEGAETKGYDVKTVEDTSTPILNKISRLSNQIKKFSRTGEALMIKTKNGPFWKIKPRPEIFPQIENDVQLQIEKSTIKFLKGITKRFKK